MSTFDPTAEDREGLRQVFSCIDNTTLEGCDTKEKVSALCHRSLALQDSSLGIAPVAAICVYPVFVRQVRRELEGSGIKVASVAGAFPSGQSPLFIKLQEIKYAIDEGADEIDMVISRGAFLEGDEQRVFDEVAAIRQLVDGRYQETFDEISELKSVCSAHDVTLKVILETGELQTRDNIVRVSQLAIDAGADFIKTSTGKIAVSATLEAADAMLQTIKNHFEKTNKMVGFKAAGGISTPEEVLKYYQLYKDIIGEEYVNKQYFRK